jgi:hypothetical protein
VGPGHTRQSFRKRWYEHVRAFRSGRYNIRDIDGACHSRRRQFWRGWENLTVEHRTAFAAQPELREAIERQLAGQRVFVARHDDSRLAQRVEAALIDEVICIRDRSLGLLPPPFCDLPDQGPLQRGPRRMDETPIRVRNIGVGQVHGIPEYLTV